MTCIEKRFQKIKVSEQNDKKTKNLFSKLKNIFYFQFVLYSYTKESLDERLLADPSTWINLQLEMNDEILAFNDGELYRVCVDETCIDIMMPTTTKIPTAAPSITGKKNI